MILYIGNNLKSKSTNQTTLTLLSNLLKTEGYSVKISSSLNNQLLRLLSMLLAIVKYRNKIDYVLIDTYSTRSFYYALITCQLCSFLKLKYIPILHGGSLPSRLDKSPKLSKRIFNNSHTNIAVSNYLKHEFNKRGFESVFIPNVLEIVSSVSDVCFSACSSVTTLCSSSAAVCSPSVIGSFSSIIS